MCMGIPMKIIEAGPGYSLCERVDGSQVKIDTMLVGEQPADTWVLVFINAAREIVSEEDALKIADALKALEQAMSGNYDVDHLFSDLTGVTDPLKTQKETI